VPIQLILFDLDDTLFDTHTGAEAALASSCAAAIAADPRLSEAEIRSGFHAALLETEEQLARGSLFCRNGSPLDTMALYTHRWQATLLACDADTGPAGHLAAHYLACRRRYFRLFPEVEECLPVLLRRYRAALLTNGISEFQREKIDSVRLERWFPAIFVSAEVGAWKPQPEAFHYALRAVGCPPQEAVMVGDSMRHDIAGAAAVGMRTVWINRRLQPSPSAAAPETSRHAVIEDLRLLAPVLEEWEHRGQ
jgi:putative hydrolase of the HAD superfamily